MHSHRSLLVDRDFRHLRHIAVKREMRGDPSTTTGRKRLAPVCFLRDQAIGLPEASKPACMRSYHIGRYQPPRISSSRVQITFTGARKAFATATASTIKSEAGFARRPKPPPSSVV